MKAVERLYLHKDKDQDIFVDLRKPLLQHQLDGIRFLYRQFNKKSPGVIVNDPPGYGKCVQVVLFLSAARLSCHRPVLVLTHSVDLWRTLFQEWTDLSHELGVCCENAYEKLIMINPVEDGFKSKFRSRAWGVVVVHDAGSAGRADHFLNMSFHAQYKIWITSEDMKENLPRLSAVYEWLYPGQQFNADSFTARAADWKDKIQKMIFLDAFLEDVLIRRLDILLHFQGKIDKPAEIAPEKTSRKNKDPTGTKVKRSKKRKIEDDDEEIATTRNTKTRDNLAPILEENIDIEDFIVTNKPLGTNILNDTSEKSKVNNKNVNEKSDLNVGSVKTGVKPTSNVGIIDNNRRNDVPKVKIVDIEMDQVDNDTSKVIVPGTEDADVIFKNSKSVANKNNSTFIAETEDSENTEAYECSTLKWDDTQNASNNITDVGTNNKNLDNKNGTNEKIAEDLEEISTLKYEDNSQNTSNDDDASCEVQNDMASVSKSKDKEHQDNTNSKMESKGNIKNIDDVDAALAAYEAKALQRLKGSFLDSIF